MVPPPIRLIDGVGRLHQQETQEGAALLADVSQALASATRLLARDEPNIAAHLLATMKTFRNSQNQHKSERRDGANSGMGHQPLHLRSFFRAAC